MTENDCEIKNEILQIKVTKFCCQITFFIKEGVTIERVGLYRERKLSIKQKLYALLSCGIITSKEYLKYIENLGKVLSNQKVWSIDYIYKPESICDKISYKLNLLDVCNW